MAEPYIQTCFQLLQSILLEAFGTETLLFTPPYGDFSQIDRGIRNIMWSDYLEKDMEPSLVNEDPSRRLVVVKSNLGFYNMIVLLSEGDTPDFISIGPFRAEAFSTEFFGQVAKDIGQPVANVTFLRRFYEGLPYVNLSAIVNVTKRVVAAYFPAFADLSPTYMEFSERMNTVEINRDMLQEYVAEYAETYQQTLSRFLSALQRGDTEEAQRNLKLFLKETRFASAQNISDCKNELFTLNVYCEKALLETAIHPSYVLKLSGALKLKIGSISGRDALMGMPKEICHKYCLLVKNYSFPEYSQTVRGVINYIYLHLEENLTLSFLAQHFQKNASSLSGAFSKEVGMSMTDFIHQTRINEALRYFNTTKMSVSEVAVAVGFQDFAYFSRLFRRQIGCSPREYCRGIR